jgi:hypothetical protein
MDVKTVFEWQCLKTGRGANNSFRRNFMWDTLTPGTIVKVGKYNGCATLEGHDEFQYQVGYSTKETAIDRTTELVKARTRFINETMQRTEMEELEEAVNEITSLHKKRQKDLSKKRSREVLEAVENNIRNDSNDPTLNEAFNDFFLTPERRINNVNIPYEASDASNNSPRPVLNIIDTNVATPTADVIEENDVKYQFEEDTLNDDDNDDDDDEDNNKTLQDPSIHPNPHFQAAMNEFNKVDPKLLNSSDQDTLFELSQNNPHYQKALGHLMQVD